MLDVYSDRFANQSADSVHCRALAAHPGALEDEAIWKRLHHIHAIQGVPRRLEGQQALAAGSRAPPHPWTRCAAARRYYRKLAEFLDGDAPKRLDEVLRVPWFPDPQRPIRLAKTMQQVVMHSEHHRGQNAIRLRELGSAMPPTD